MDSEMAALSLIKNHTCEIYEYYRQSHFSIEITSFCVQLQKKDKMIYYIKITFVISSKVQLLVIVMLD